MEIPRTEVLRYLGYTGKSIDPYTDQLIDECLREIREISNPKHKIGVYDLEFQPDGIYVQNTTLILDGQDIANHLQYANKCALMAVTLGIQVDKRIKFYNLTNLTKAVILDACATAYVETVCDQVESKLRTLAQQDDMQITFRFSPGYGDLPIEMQNDLLQVLNAPITIGLTATPEHILLPLKSVTAIIGFGILPENLLPTKRKTQKDAINNEKCKTCLNYRHCIYLQEGKYCEYRKRNP